MNGFSRYVDSGRGPAVVLLHDSLLAPDSWDGTVAVLLDSGFRVIVPDLASLAGVESIDDFSRATVDLLDRLGIGRAAFCGLGLGGTILLSLLEAYRDRIVGASFINARPGSDDVHEKLRRAQVLAGLRSDDDCAVRDELVKMLFDGRERHLSHATRRHLKKQVCHYDRSVLIGYVGAMQGRRNYTALLKDIRLPAQVVYGRHDTICHPGYARFMASRLANCPRAVGLDGGHLLQYEQAEALAAVLLEFLREIVPRRSRRKPLCPLKAA
jgi:3-oxoadipate enol-lactonase